MSLLTCIVLAALKLAFTLNSTASEIQHSDYLSPTSRVLARRYGEPAKALLA